VVTIRGMTTRGPYARGLAKREEILTAALEIFARHGYDRTSFREVARATGLSQAGLLHHFNSKEELFVEVLRRRDARNEDRFDVNHGSPVTVEGLVSVVRHNSEEPGLVRLFVAMSAESTDEDSTSRGFFQERYQHLVADLAEDVRHRQQAGEVAEDLDPSMVASLLLAAADGLQIQWLLDPDGVDMGDRLGALWEAFRRPR
jgi:AcrR family transcriptional regulator